MIVVPDIRNHDKMTALLGKRVRVMLNMPQPGDRTEAVIAEGKLIGFGQGGEFEVIEDDGFVHYCWPMLDIEEVTSHV
jgi:hypothetical protein